MNPSPMVMVVMPVEAAMVVMVTVVAMPVVTMAMVAMAMSMMATACLGFSRSSGQTNSARYNTGNKEIFEHLVPFKHKLFVAR